MIAKRPWQCIFDLGEQNRPITALANATASTGNRLSLIHICGFAVPIRQGYADEVVIVTSGEKMALYAAANIKKALDNFQERGYAKLRGIVLNCRNVPDEIAIVEDFVQRIGTETVSYTHLQSRIMHGMP